MVATAKTNGANWGESGVSVGDDGAEFCVKQKAAQAPQSPRTVMVIERRNRRGIARTLSRPANPQSKGSYLLIFA
jgi:hypothetical protein